MAGSMQCQELWKPIGVMVAVNLGYAIGNVLMKKVLGKGISALVLVTYRQITAAIFLTPIAYFFERKNKPGFSIIWYLFLSSLVGVTLPLYLLLLGFEYTTVTYACAFINVVPVFAFMLALPFGLEKVNMKTKSGIAKISGASVCICGALILLLYKGIPLINSQSEETSQKINQNNPTPSSTYKSERWIIGSIVLTASSLFWSSWFLIQAKISKRYPCQYSSTALLSVFAAIQSAILTFITEKGRAKWLLKGKLEIMTVIYTGMVGSGLCYVGMSWCIKKRDPIFTAAFTPLIQIFVSMFDISILKETIHLGSIAGSVLVIVGMYMLLWGKTKEAEGSITNETQANQGQE